jgi:hypothetical protein
MSSVHNRFFTHYRCPWCQDIPKFWKDAKGNWQRGTCPYCEGYKNLVIKTVRVTGDYL